MPTSRRFLGNVPRLVGRVWNDITRELQDYLERLRDSVTNGIPGGFGDSVPPTIQAGDTGDSGVVTDGWASAQHEHPVETDTAVDLGDDNSEGTGTALARADHVHQLRVRVRENADSPITRRQIHVSDSASIAWTVTDDAGNNEIDVSAAVVLAGITHALLSSTHSDTVASAVTKGSLIVGNTTPAWEEFPVGSDGEVLTANSAEPFGVEWAAGGGGGGGGWTDDGAIVRLTTAGDEVIIGSATAVAGTKLEVVETAAIRRHSDVDTEGPQLDFVRTRNTEGSPNPVLDGDRLGYIRVKAWGGTEYLDALRVAIEADDDWDDDPDNYGPARVIVNVGSTANDCEEVLRIHGTNIYIGHPPDRTHDLAQAVLRVNKFYDCGLIVADGEAGDSITELTTNYRYRTAGTPGANMGGYVSWRLEGFSNESTVPAGRIGVAWETAQTNDTTDRDAYMNFELVLNASIAEKMRLTSGGILRPAGDNTQDFGTTALRWSSAHFGTRVNIGVTSSGGSGFFHIVGGASVTVETYMDSFAAQSNIVIRRAGGSPGSASAVSSGQSLGQIQWWAHEGTAYREIARIAPFVATAPSNDNISGDLYFYLRNTTSAINFVAGFDYRGSFVLGPQSGSLATTATDGFIYIRSCAGTPTGVPTAFTGAVPLVYDSTNNILYAYSNGAWRAH